MKRSVTVLMAALLLVSAVLAACGGRPGGSAGGKVRSEEGPFGKYEREIAVTRVGETSPSIVYIEGESVDNNFITEFYKEKLNIQYRNKWIVDTSEAEEKMNLAIASNDLPDVFTVNIEQLTRLIRADQIEDLTEVYNQYASDNLRAVLEFQDRLAFIPSTQNGKIYGLPRTNDFANNIAIMYIREDWLQRLNLQAPRTLSELMEVAKAFVERDPDGNGQKDTYAIAVDQTLVGSSNMTLDAIGAAKGAYPKIWIEGPDGGLVYGSIQPEMKEALRVMKELYAMGAFDPEFAVKNYSKVKETVDAGKIGISFGPFWLPLHLEDILDNDPNAVWKAYPIMVNDQGQLKPKALPFAYFWYVVRKGFEYPEALVKSLNLWYEIYQGMYSDWFNEMYVTKYSHISNVHNYALPQFYDPPQKNLNQGVKLREAKAANDAGVLTHPESKRIWEIMESGSKLGKAYEVIFYESERILLENYKEYQYDKFYAPPTKTMIERKVTLDALEDETFPKIIMGTLPLDAFDDFVSEWLRLGGETIQKEVNEWYDSVR